MSSFRNHDVSAVRSRLSPDATWWFRTCETVSADVGRRFARDFADHQGVAVAGHTYVIGPFQSGLHLLRPGAEPHWTPDEGLSEGTPSRPIRARWSRWSEPHTITCLHGAVPPGW